MKKKWPRKELKVDTFAITIVPYSDQDDVGYIRFARHSDAEYFGSIDSTARLPQLKAIHKALGQMIKQKAKP